MISSEAISENLAKNSSDDLFAMLSKKINFNKNLKIQMHLNSTEKNETMEIPRKYFSDYVSTENLELSTINSNYSIQNNIDTIHNSSNIDISPVKMDIFERSKENLSLDNQNINI